MKPAAWREPVGRFVGANGMVLVLALLCAAFALATWREEAPTGPAAVQALATRAAQTARPGEALVVVAGTVPDEAAFAQAVALQLASLGRAPLATVAGDPPTVRARLEALAAGPRRPTLAAVARSCATWPIFGALGLRVVAPATVRRSQFLAPSNLRNVADQIAVIAILAVGMTAVILTGGIDLSVGSLVALAAVLTAWLVRAAGGPQASAWALAGCALAAVLGCGLVGLFSGVMITACRVPPFIATLAVMQVASGLAFLLTRGQTLYDLPDACTWLGRGSCLGLPNAVVLMLALYAAAHLVMTRTVAGRAVYAVGGNPEAARLSGLRTARTLLGVYVVSGLTAGLGGVITTSQLKAGAPTYGVMYELYVIAAVVVGGTSLAGGEGRMLGTLVGAFIIAVIRNGMNLTDVQPYTQKVVLGLVILGAVLLDKIRRRA